MHTATITPRSQRGIFCQRGISKVAGTKNILFCPLRFDFARLDVAFVPHGFGKVIVLPAAMNTGGHQCPTKTTSLSPGRHVAWLHGGAPLRAPP